MYQILRSQSTIKMLKKLEVIYPNTKHYSDLLKVYIPFLKKHFLNINQNLAERDTLPI